MTNRFIRLQWKAEIQDFCPSTRILLIGCKTDLRTDVCTRIELSNQKQTPISHEQVGPVTLLMNLNNLTRGSPCFFFPLFLALCFDQFLCQLSGIVYGQAARSRGLPGVLRLYVGEEHPQRFPYCGSGLHWQSAARGQAQPCAPPLQETPTPSQQDRAALLHIQQRQVQELLHYVNTAGCWESAQGPGENSRHFSGGLLFFFLQIPSQKKTSLSVTELQRTKKNCVTFMFVTCTKKKRAL